MLLQSAAAQSIHQQRQEQSPQVVWPTNKNASFHSPGSWPKSPPRPRPPHRLEQERSVQHPQQQLPQQPQPSEHCHAGSKSSS